MFTLQKYRQPGQSEENTEKEEIRLVVKTSVRRLVEFLLRSGDIHPGKSTLAGQEAMLEGGHLHRKIQRAQKDTYESEVPLFVTRQEEGFDLVVEGRADGIDRGTGEDGQPIIIIDEIKCTYRDMSQTEEPEPLHLAQAKCYGAIYALENEVDRLGIQITYCHMETEHIHRLYREYSRDDLVDWFEDCLDQCCLWAKYYVESREKRNESIKGLEFPYPYRPGQKQLTAMAYRAMDQGKHVFLQAPTGVGKTISMVYPALQEMGQERVEHFSYLTARTITRTVAEDTLALLRKQDLYLRSVTVTAKEKICVQDEMVCDPELCPRAKGHYDRINACLYDMLTHREDFTRPCILDYSERYMVCPYELTFELSPWSDGVICDYNYVFDPHAFKNLHGNGSSRDVVYLVDEAHNLLDRAREMYSADLSREDFRLPKSVFKDRVRKIFLAIRRCDVALRELGKEGGDRPDPDKLYHPLFHLIELLTDYLTDQEDFDQRDEILEFYFKISHFFMILDTLDEGYEVYGDGEKMHYTIHLYCIDPSDRLAECLEGCRSGIFFSATLLPISYYRSLLGGGKMQAYAIPSPFPRDNRLIGIAGDVTSRYSRRGEDQYRRILHYTEITVSKKTGNYMIFFPSYEMLGNVVRFLPESTLELLAEILVQEPQMGEAEKEEFLDRFQEKPKRSVVGFCVLGSIFSEGIDLTGDRLSGVMIVGTGLPMICKEREIVREHFDRAGGRGYDYAYRYPGMNKVLQAAGRVIRTASDRGVILLMDDRFLQRENQELFPADWDSYYPVYEQTWENVLDRFWADESPQTKEKEET